jgi:hypothetical protein
MSDLYWLSTAQMRRIEPYFPLSHGLPCPPLLVGALGEDSGHGPRLAQLLVAGLAVSAVWGGVSGPSPIKAESVRLYKSP